MQAKQAILTIELVCRILIYKLEHVETHVAWPRQSQAANIESQSSGV